MKLLDKDELIHVQGGRNFLTVVSGVVFGATIGMILGIPVGPGGMAAGALTGAFNGASAGVIKEGAEGLVAITNGTGI